MRRTRGITPASSATQRLTSRLPNSKGKSAETSWYLVAEHSGSTDNLTNTPIIRIRADHREITLVLPSIATLLSRCVKLRRDRRAQRSAARQALPPPQRASGIPKRSLMICTPPDARGSILSDCSHLWRIATPHRNAVVYKGSICREYARHLLKGPLRFEHGMRLVEASAWQVCSANYFSYSA